MLNKSVQTLAYGLISRASLLLINLISARLLVPHDYGLISILIVTVSSISAMSSLGIGITCNRVASREYKINDDLVSSTFTMSLIASIFISLILSAIYTSVVIDGWGGYDSTILAAIVFLISMLMTSYIAIEGIFYGIGYQRDMIIGSVITLLIAASAMSGLIIWMGLSGAVIALLLYRSVALSIFGLKLFQKTTIRPDILIFMKEFRHARKAFIGISLPLAIASVMSGPVTAYAMAVVQKEFGAHAIAEFGFVYQFFLIAIFIPGVLGNYFLAYARK